MQDFAGLRPTVTKKKARIDTGYYFNQGDIQLKIGKINITNGTFNNEKETTRGTLILF